MPLTGPIWLRLGRDVIVAWWTTPRQRIFAHRSISVTACSQDHNDLLTANFLHDGERYWLSEIELDGTIQCPDPSSPAVVQTCRDVIKARFLAYRAGHARHFASSAP